MLKFAIFRIYFGIILFLDLFNKLTYFKEFQTDSGVLQSYSLPFAASFFLFASYSLCSFFFLIGYNTRIMAFFSWVLLLSIQYNDQAMLYGGDFLLCLLLLWSIFLPLDQTFSVDSVVYPSNETKTKNILGIYPIALQMALMYFFSAMLKNGKSWQDYSAGILALQLEQYVSSFGIWIRNFPSIVKLGTFISWWLEFLAGFLLLLPYKENYIRGVVVIALMVMHTIFNLSLDIGLFSIIAISGLILLLPESYFKFLVKHFKFSENIKNSTLRYLKDFSFTIHKVFNFNLIRFNDRYLKLTAILLMFLSLLGNIESVKKWDIHLQKELNQVISILGLKQNWNMFAPDPLQLSGRYVFKGFLEDGSLIDPFDDNKSNKMKNLHWRKYFLFITKNKGAFLRKEFSIYLCNKWNSDFKNKRLLSVEGIFIYRQIGLEFSNYRSEERKMTLLDERCPLRHGQMVR